MFEQMFGLRRLEQRHVDVEDLEHDRIVALAERELVLEVVAVEADDVEADEANLRRQVCLQHRAKHRLRLGIRIR